MNHLSTRIFSVFRKEATEIFRDKRTLAIMIGIPLLLYPILMLLSTQVMVYMGKSQEEARYTVSVQFSPDPILTELMEENSEKYKLDFVEISPQKALKSLENDDIDAYIKMEGSDFYIVYKSAVDTSDGAANRLQAFLKDYGQRLTEHAIRSQGLDEKAILEPITVSTESISNDDQMTGKFLGMILPLILIISIFSGAMYPAIDVTAGEKERGTLETLLTLPITGIELIVGKFLAVSLVAVISAVLNFISIAVMFLFLITNIFAQAGQASLQLNPMALLPGFLLTLVCMIAFSFFTSAVVLCISAMAKSFKEAQNLLTPVMIVFMIPAYVTMIPNVELTGALAAVPIVNIALLIKASLMQTINVGSAAVVLISNLAYSAITIGILAKLYSSESILFGGKEAGLLQKRKNIKAGNPISFGDGVIICSVAFLVSLYLGGTVQTYWGIYGLAVTQLLLLSVAVLPAVYLKLDFRKTFSLEKPKVRAIFGTFVLWVGGYLLISAISLVLLPLSPQNYETLKSMENIFKGVDNIWISLVVVALLPAICEEFLFRGVIYSAAKSVLKPRGAILLTSLLFSAFHIDLIRLIPTFILGVLLCYVTYKSGSIICAILLHFVNNSIAILSIYYPGQFENQVPGESTPMILIGFVIASIVIMGLGIFIFQFRTKTQDKNLEKPINNDRIYR